MEEWDEVIGVNLTSVFILCQEAGKLMLKKGYGKIITIASMNSFFGGQTIPAYAAAKGGVAQLTKELTNDWLARGVNVNAIAPGYMATEMNKALLDPENSQICFYFRENPGTSLGNRRGYEGDSYFPGLSCQRLCKRRCDSGGWRISGEVRYMDTCIKERISMNKKPEKCTPAAFMGAV